MSTPKLDEEAIFHIARKLPSELQDNYLDQVCSDDTARRGRIEALLRHEQSDFLQPDTNKERSSRNSIDEETYPQNDRYKLLHYPQIDRYKLLQIIGEGGFGVVYLAEQRQPVKRKVALKVIKAGMDTRAVVARFEAERQALAMLDHPHIAKVLDGGATKEGRPYFVMELVSGVAITTYCDDNELPIAERLALFVNVCEAIQHAHQKGIIHRDLKPSNVMVTLHDGKPVVKVIDFGVAKAIDSELTEKTLFTAYGQMIGTPQYMSPEQAEMSGLGIDTRTDIYALGVMLYELLTGTTPLEAKTLRDAGIAAVQRLIKEQESPKPSTRLSSFGAQLTHIAKHRSITPERLHREVSGDLDWIVMKALEKDRTRRYDTVSSLAADVERYLRDDEVEARPPSAAYRLKKFVRRNTALVTMGATIAAILIAATAISLWQARRASLERDRSRLAEEAALTAQQEAQELAEKEGAARQTAERLATSEASAREEMRRLLYVSDMNVALKHWNDGQVEEVETLLKRHEPRHGEEDLRGFEWYYLWRLTQRAASVPSVELKQPVRVLAFSSQGSFVAAACGQEVLLFDARSPHELVHSFQPHPELDEQMWGIALSPSSETLVTTTGNEFTLWDLTDPRSPIEIATRTTEEPVVNVAFSPSGRRFAVGDAEGVTVWNVEPRLEIAKRVTVDGGYVIALSEKTLAMAGRYTWQPWVVDLEDRKPPYSLKGHTARINSLAISPDGQLLASGSSDSLVKLWNLETAQETATLRDHRGHVWSVEFSADGETLASVSMDMMVRLWDVSQVKLLNILKVDRFDLPEGRHWEKRRLLAFSPEGGTLVSAASDKTLKWWNIDNLTEQDATILGAHEVWVDSVAFSPDGTMLASVARDENVLKLWDVASRREIKQIETNGQLNHFVCFSPNGRVFANGWDSISEWEVGTWKETPSVSPSEVTYSLDGRSVLAQTPLGRVWDVSSDTARRLPIDDRLQLSQYEFSDDTKMLVKRNRNSTISIRSSERPVKELPAYFHGSAGIMFAPDRRLLAIHTNSGDSIELWDTVAGELKGVLKHTTQIWTFAMSPDGKTLASCGQDGIVTLWNLVLQAKVGILNIRSGTAVAFSPDGTILATGGADGKIRLWQAATKKEVQAANW